MKCKEYKRFIKNLKIVLGGSTVLNRLNEVYEMAKGHRDTRTMLDVVLQIAKIEKEQNE